jgi:hypothetical protein
MQRLTRALTAAVGIAGVGLAVPGTGAAQGSAIDSTSAAKAIATAIRERIPDSGENRGAAMDERPSSGNASAPWNLLVGRELKAIDSTIIVTSPTTYTTRVNIVSVDVRADSMFVRLAITQCRNTSRGVWFGGTGYDYVFRKAGVEWVLASNRARGSGDGRC